MMASCFTDVTHTLSAWWVTLTTDAATNNGDPVISPWQALKEER